MTQAGPDLTLDEFQRTYPILSRHLGVWEAQYIITDPQGQLIDRYRSRNEFRVNGSDYSQRNIYTWDDGRVRDVTFQAKLRDGALWFDTPILAGVAREVSDSVILLTFTYRDQPISVIETITQVDDARSARTMQYFQDGNLVKVAAVYDEHKVAD